jgi:histidinol-phosphatase (PHP family)
MEEFVQDAIGRGFDCYGISSHAPIDFQTRWSKNQQHIDVYLQDFFRLKEKYQTKISNKNRIVFGIGNRLRC